MNSYYVYLDESGDFTDSSAGKKKSLVGGFFWKKGDMSQDANEMIKEISRFTKDNHATELDKTEKGEKILDMLKTAKNYPISFVIFQNDIKKVIINSTQTYLTVITEGLIQLMKKLVILDNEPIELNVVAGFKKDTTQEVTSSFVGGYINVEQYRERINEKIAIEKARLRNEKFQHSIIKIELADDKRNERLILCDYICYFWFSRKSNSAFRQKTQSDDKYVTIKSEITKLYDSDLIFPLFSTEENEHVNRMVQEGFYADALFEACAGMLSDSNCRLIKQSFIKLRPKQIHNQLGNLADYIGDIIVFRQSQKLVKQVLDGAEELYEFLTENSILDVKFYLDIQLYLLAYYNNAGQTEHMEQIFKKIEPEIARYTAQTLDIDYLMIYYTRLAVYLLEHRRYSESYSICDNMELLLQLVEEAVRSNDCIKLEGDIKSEQLGKVLGTKLQALIPMCYLGEEEYDNACEVSDRAIDQFTYKYDLVRQYQYRAELEAVCGHKDIAIEWIEKSFDGTKWKDYISSSSRTIYDTYNLLFIAAHSKRIDPSFSAEIANHVYSTCKSDFSNESLIAEMCNLYIGYSLVGDKSLDGRGKSVLGKALQRISNQESLEYSFVRKAMEKVLEGEEGLKALYEI